MVFVKLKKDNVLKPNGKPGPRQYKIQFHFFLDPYIYIEEYKAFLF